ARRFGLNARDGGQSVVTTEGPVRLEDRVVEELVRGRMVGEPRVPRREGSQILGRVPRYHGSYVKESSLEARPEEDLSFRESGVAELAVVRRLQRLQCVFFEPDLDPQIRPREGDRLRKCSQRDGVSTRAVDADDVRTPSSQQLDEAEVLPMAA